MVDGLVPHIVRSNITSPKDCVRRKFVYLVPHLEEDTWRDVTLCQATKRTSLDLRVLWKTIFLPAAQHIVAFRATSNFVVEIEMHVSELYQANSFPWIFRVTHALV